MDHLAPNSEHRKLIVPKVEVAVTPTDGMDEPNPADVDKSDQRGARAPPAMPNYDEFNQQTLYPDDWA